MFKELNILRVLLEKPTQEFSVREVAKHAKITPATASKYLKEFTQQDILQHRHERGADLYKADLDSDRYRDLKRYYTITKLRASKVLQALTETYHKPTIVLFGSAATGLDTEESDLDILVIAEKTTAFPEKKRYEQKLGRAIQLFVHTNLKELGNKHLISSVLNGIVLQGELRWTSPSVDEKDS